MADRMDWLQESPLSCAPHWLDRAALIGPGSQWNWAGVHAEAHALAALLDPDETVFNLCESRLGFLVVWLAALQQGCAISLPPSGASADIGALVSSSARPCIVLDAKAARHGSWPRETRLLAWQPQLSSVSRQSHRIPQGADRPRISLYTSGSTGRPERNHKTLSQLVEGATKLGARLKEVLDGDDALIPSVVCSVPPQHMFGLELSVMLPLLHGMPVIEARPLLPADASAAISQCASGALWVTTPAHLRALVKAGESMRGCRAVITSTMPLDPDLAALAEELVAAPVIEIYGSTETGALATRRPSRTTRWEPLSGVSIASCDNLTVATGQHFPSSQFLSDRVAVDSSGGFQLLGRGSDLVKVAGKRSSLASLDLLLQRLPGLGDGVFYQPREPQDAARLVLIYEGPPIDKAAALAWLRQHVDSVFLPRSFIHVDALPRTANGKIARHVLDDVYAARKDGQT
jgi:acyl-coenzyme A synthetase/AMP-(fatty) acid ligase